MLFMQIDNVDVNMNQVTHIYYCQNGDVEFNFAVLDGDTPASLKIYGAEAKAFIEAWRYRAIPGVTIYKVC